jgi:imidazoleglycerol phosphate dehydratase HisB
MAIHIEASGRDDHHVAEAAYKAVGRALRTALRVESSGIPSTKGRL